MPVFLCCPDHVERALEKIIDDFEAPPQLEKVTKRKQCAFCEKDAIYVVSN